MFVSPAPQMQRLDQSGGCRLSDGGMRGLLFPRLDANVVKAKFPESACLPMNLPALLPVPCPLSTLVWIICQALALVSLPHTVFT